MTGSGPVVDITLNFKGVLAELYWDGISGKDKQSTIEQTLSSEIKQNCEQVIRSIQAVGCDALGIGDYVRARYNSYWERVNWDNIYPTVKFNINVDVNITNHGIIR